MIMNATNHVTNGDFSNGTTGWYGVQSELITANNILSVVGNGVGAVSIFAQQTNTDYIMGNMYYVKARLRITGSQCIAAVVYINSTTQGVASYIDAVNIQNYPIVNQWYEINAIVIPTVDFGGKVRIGGYHNYPTAEDTLGKTMDVQYAALIDLTATFGAGNEPTAAQMDRLLTLFPNSWFDGTENLFLAKWALNELRRLDNEKANKDQEAWITPTLVNGATGTFQYRKNEFGRLEFKGDLTQASTASHFCIAIAGYRPSAWIRCPITSIDGVVSMLIMSDVGALYLNTPLAGKTISFSGISINIQ